MTLTLGPVDSDGTIQADSCWRDANCRGFGRFASECPAGKEKELVLCYDYCDDGYNGVGSTCWQDCPDDFTHYGTLCMKPTAWWEENPDCPSGMTDIGIFCRKDRYGRGDGTAPICTDGEEKDGLLCYPQC